MAWGPGSLVRSEVYERMARVQADHWWYEGRRRVLSAKIQQLPLNDGARIMEVGCGPGANLRMLSRFGTVEAFEPSEWARQHASNLAGTDVRDGSLPNDVPFQGPFDLIAALDVIEHIREDLSSLKVLRNLLKPTGYAVFTVPAYAYLWSAHDESNHHFRRYTRPQFSRLLLESGYRIRYISYYNTLLFPVVAAVRIFKKLTKARGDGDDRMPRCDALNSLLLMVFASERAVLRRFTLPFGVSILAICSPADNVTAVGAPEESC